MNILIAEDQKDMQKIICLYLEREGYRVSVADNGEIALDLLCKNKFDLLIADWMMPKKSGIELLKNIYTLKIDIKTIMLTAKNTSIDEIEGLKNGADDYIKKPFEPDILLLRIHKLFPKKHILTCKNLMLDLDKKLVFLHGEIVKTTLKEWNLLVLLMKNKGKNLSRDYLIENVWGYDYSGDERTLDTHVRRIRNKIGSEYIKTFVGIGYRMENENIDE
ncbi:MAG: response regulator transcription factor [Spirochaetales bacterium]